MTGMRVVHLTPTYFSSSSLIGGGERYVTELARFMAPHTSTTVVTFGDRRRSLRLGDLAMEVYPASAYFHGNRINPFSIRFLSALFSADIVHVHQIDTFVSDLACLAGALIGRRLFVTDYGGGAAFRLNGKFPLLHLYDRAIAYSDFGAAHLPAVLKGRTTVIRGGVDTGRFVADTRSRDRTILYVGRILPHKGIDYLLAAFRLMDGDGYTLRIVGRVYDQSYYQQLLAAASGLNVDFLHQVDDTQLVSEYQKASVTVLPSVHTDCYGRYTPIPELMGFTLLESQACGTPVVCTDAGAMHEFVKRGVTGEVVAQNSPEALAGGIRAVLRRLADRGVGTADDCRDAVAGYSWPNIAAEHLRLYADVSK